MAIGKRGVSNHGGKTSNTNKVGARATLSRGAKPASTSNKNTRIGSLSKRMHGANGKKGMPK